MKRFIIIFGVFSLLLNLGDDGYLGKVNYVAPLNLLLSMAEQQDDQEQDMIVLGQGIFTVAVVAAYLLEISRHYYKSVQVEVRHPRTITLCSPLGSSGGLPW